MLKQLLTFMLAGAATASVWAVPARRGYIEKIGPDGQSIKVRLVGDEFGHYFTDNDGRKYIADNTERLAAATEEHITELTARREARYQAVNEARASRRRVPGVIGKFPGSAFPTSGKQKSIVILVEYKDKKFTLGDDAAALEYYQEMLNKDGFNKYGATGSVHEYFIDSSNGQFDCQFDVFGPVTLKNNMSYYGGNDIWGNDKHPEDMVVEACQALDATVNFKDYDRDNDGYVDNVYVIYAGQGEASGGSANTVWPHSWQLSGADKALKLDGVTIDSYGCSNEWETYTNNGKGSPDGIGTFVHEFSHVMGLPDLYHTEDPDTYYTPGSWSVLDYGPYNNDGRTPPAYSSFERNAMGWIELKELTKDAGDVILPELNYSNEAYVITNPADSKEYYLIESRQKAGWDKYLPATGMLIWHVDFDSSTWLQNAVNNTKTHQGVDLIEADGKAEKQDRTGGDCFPGTSKKTSYSPKWWSKNSVGLDINDIALTADGGVTFTVAENTGSSNNPGGEPDGDYFTVGDIISGEGTANCNVRGYIVGWVASWTDNGVFFTADNCKMDTNIILADSPEERDRDNLIPVQLPNKTQVRTDVNLKDNPGNLGRYIELTGKATTYFNAPGLKECSAYRFLDMPQQDAIEEVNAACGPDSAAPVYDLQGRRVVNPRPGHIYIQSGRKIMF